MSARGRQYARFLMLALAVVVALLAIGVLPTRRLAGDAAPAAMVVGCAISFVAAALAGWLLLIVPGETPTARMQRASLAMAVRLAVVVVLGLAAVVGGDLARMPLLFWLGATYVALLPLEVKLAIRDL
jgi:hypothetical protein